MMCLGWYNRPTCAAREQIQVAPGVSQCPSGMWFYLSAAVILLAGTMRKQA